MRRRVNVEELFREYLSKEDADALLAKIDRMIKEKKSAAEIERVIATSISRQIENRIIGSVTTEFGPVVQSKEKEIRADIKSTVRPILNPCIEDVMGGRIVGHRGSGRAKRRG